jgi:uncharacterized protein (TIGR02231 family)
MKKQVFNLLLVFIPILSFSQNIHEQVLKTEIKRVKLFLTAGEMTHETPVKLAKGRNKLIFSGISAFADPRTIQFSGSGGVYRLVSISTEMDFLAAEQWNPRIKIVADSLEDLKDRYQLNIDLLSSYQAELGILNTNKDLKGQNTLTIDQIKVAGEYYRTRTFEINKTITKIKKEQEVLSAKINDTRYQLTELNYTENQRSNQVIVLIDIDNTTDISGVLKYLVSDCGWAATYDLSATDLNQPINLKYKAQVYNNTGNEWKNVGLTLSTSDPLLSAASPVLNPFYIRYGEQADYPKKGYVQPLQQKAEFRTEVMNEINMANQRAYDNYVLDQKTPLNGEVFSSGRSDFKNGGKKVSTVAMKQIEISDLNAEFVITHPFSCPTDAKPYIVEIKEINMPATFTHVSIPKLDQGSFLLANIVGWQELDLIPGPTNVYFAGNYVGVSEMNTNNVDDTLSLSFGRDSKIQVIRKLKSEMSTKKISGSTKKDTYFYDIQVRNNRPVPVKINVFDQIPLSSNGEITVSVETIGTGKKNDLTGEVNYFILLQPGETVNLELGYSVKYPKNAKISTRTFRTISSPSF